jgi:hypothetical protein
MAVGYSKVENEHQKLVFDIQTLKDELGVL